MTRRHILLALIVPLLSVLSARAGLVAHWKLDETSGTVAADGSGNNHHGTLNNFPSSPWTAGQIAGALAFDGVRRSGRMLAACCWWAAPDAEGACQERAYAANR